MEWKRPLLEASTGTSNSGSIGHWFIVLVIIMILDLMMGMLMLVTIVVAAAVTGCIQSPANEHLFPSQSFDESDFKRKSAS